MTNSINLKLVLIEAGTFQMGSPDSDHDCYADEKPQHDVKITKAFYIGKYHVTRGQFRAFVEDTGYKTDAEKDGKGGGGYDAEEKAFVGPVAGCSWRDTGFPQTDEHPVVNVSWNDAVAFCEWLSRKEGKEYRLPTEAEWEYCCRARTTTRFYCGDAEESLKKVANIADLSLKAKWDYSGLKGKRVEKLLEDWFDRVSWDDGYPFTAPVGQFAANDFGLDDMHGNAWEWCLDGYDRKYYKSSPREDPQGPEDRAGALRVIRGGSFNVMPRFCRAATRGKDAPVYSSCILGFRVVRVQ